MPAPTGHKTVQARILAYAQEIGWTYVPRFEAEARRGLTEGGLSSSPLSNGGLEKPPSVAPPTLYFGDLLHAQVRAFNPKYKRAEGALIGEFQRLRADIAGNRDFLTYLRNQGKFFCVEENRGEGDVHKSINLCLKSSTPPNTSLGEQQGVVGRLVDSAMLTRGHGNRGVVSSSEEQWLPVPAHNKIHPNPPLAKEGLAKWAILPPFAKGRSGGILRFRVGASAPQLQMILAIRHRWRRL